MTIEKEIQEAIKIQTKRFENDKSFQDLKKFYDAMKEQGVVLRQEYTFPPLDTVGYIPDFTSA